MRKVTGILALIIVLAIGAALFLHLGLGHREGFGQIASLYVADGVTDIGVVNLVTSIYLGYRAYDTFGEAIVLFTSAIGIAIFLKKEGEV